MRHNRISLSATIVTIDCARIRKYSDVPVFSMRRCARGRKADPAERSASICCGPSNTLFRITHFSVYREPSKCVQATLKVTLRATNFRNRESADKLLAATFVVGSAFRKNVARKSLPILEVTAAAVL